MPATKVIRYDTILIVIIFTQNRCATIGGTEIIYIQIHGVDVNHVQLVEDGLIPDSFCGILQRNQQG